MSDAARAEIASASWLADYFGDEVTPEAINSLANALDAYAAEQTAAKDAEIAGLKEDWRILLREHGEASQRAEAANSQTAALRAALEACNRFLKHSGNQRAILGGKFVTPSARYDELVRLQKVTDALLADSGPAGEEPLEPLSLQVRRGVRDGEVRWLTDDLDQERIELAIFHGGNGDWYVGVVPEGEAGMHQFVRVRTSGVDVPAMPTLIANLYRLLADKLAAVEKARQ